MKNMADFPSTNLTKQNAKPNFDSRKETYQFKKRDLPVLVNVLAIPNQFTCSQRTVSDGMEGLCMVLRRMAYPCRYSDLIPRFGRPVPILSMICNRVIDYIYDSHVHRLTSWNPQLLGPCLSSEVL